MSSPNKILSFSGSNNRNPMDSEEKNPIKRCDGSFSCQQLKVKEESTQTPTPSKTKVYLIVLTENTYDSYFYIFPEDTFKPEWRDVIDNNEDRLDELCELMCDEWGPYQQNLSIFNIKVKIPEGGELLTCSSYC
jgi:hypothetical protein